MRWLVVAGAGPLAKRPPGPAHAQPPGPGFPRQAPSVYTSVVTGPSVTAPPGSKSDFPGGETAMVIFDGFSQQLPDIDPEETAEWVDSLEMVADERGRTRARFLLMKLLDRARELGVGLPNTVSSPYINTIPPEKEPWFPGDEHIERR